MRESRGSFFWEALKVRNDILEQACDQAIESRLGFLLDEELPNRIQVLLEVCRDADPQRRGYLAPTLRRILVLTADLRDAHCASGVDVRDAAHGLVDQGQMNVLTLEPVVMVKPARINQRNVTLSVSGDDLLPAAPHLFGEVCETGSNLVIGTMSSLLIPMLESING